MKIATYRRQETVSYGLVTEDGLLDVPAAWPGAPADVSALLAAGDEAMAALAALDTTSAQPVPLDSVRLLAPVPRPGKLLGLAVNYAAHHRESAPGQSLPDDPRRTTTPRPFLMPPTVLNDPGATIPWPRYSTEIDYEVELAVVIGRRGKDIPAEGAARYIAGYTIANDVSARSVTHARGRAPRDKDRFFDWLHGKWADGFLPLGPCLVTADEVGDPTALDISLTVNGQTRQHANTRQMIFTVYDLVSFVSRLMTLRAGDVIATGTPSGVGMATGEFLSAGDTITCRIEGLGELTNTLGPRPESFYTPCQGH